ncbi:MAG: metalloregulator ArsR/SmtB family transcription factor [Herpetosiphon sp.]
MSREGEVFRALADPTRRAIFERLVKGEASVSEIKADFAVSQPAVSQHLAALRQAGLLIERRSGRHMYYRVEPQGLRPLVDWLDRYQAFWHHRLEALKRLLQEMDP